VGFEIVNAQRNAFFGGSMSTESHHSLFRHRTRVDPKGSASVSHELDLNQIDFPAGSGAPQ
jgi:hypothetical protein